MSQTLTDGLRGDSGDPAVEQRGEAASGSEVPSRDTGGELVERRLTAAEQRKLPRTKRGRLRRIHQCPRCRSTTSRKPYCVCETLGREVGLPDNRLTPQERYKPLNQGPRARPDPAREYASIGAPPKDSLKATTWVYEALVTGMHHIVRDKDMSEKERRKEMREQARVMKELVPLRDLAAAARLVKGDVESLTEGDGPEMVSAKSVNSAGSTRKAKRGRPRKR